MAQGADEVAGPLVRRLILLAIQSCVPVWLALVSVASAAPYPHIEPVHVVRLALRTGPDGEHQVPLPDSLHSQGGEAVHARYVFEVTLGASPRAIALYLPGAMSPMRLSLNGQVLTDGLRSPLPPRPRGRQQLRLIEVPDAWWRAGRNTVEIDVAGRSSTSLSALWVGPAPELHAMHERAVRLQVDLPALAAAVIGTIAVAALLLWGRRRSESLFAWFGIGALLWALHTGWTLSPLPLLPSPHQAVWWTAMYGFFVAPMVVFCVRLAGWRMTRFVRMLCVSALSGPVLLYAANAAGLRAEAEEYWRLGCIAAAAVGVSAVARYAFSRRDSIGLLLLATGVTSLVFALHDWFGARDPADNNPPQLTPLAGLLFAVLMAWVLIDRFVQSADALERLNQELGARVTEGRRELTHALEEMRAAREEAEMAKDEADAANRENASILAVASHDLRQPIHALGLYVGTLAAEPLTEPQRDLVQRIEAALSALDGMFNTLLDITIVDDERVPLEVVAFPLQPLLRRLAEEYAPLAFEKDLRMVCLDASHAEGWFARSDPLRIELLLRNLLANAVKYTQRGGVIVRCRLQRGDDPSWRVEIWDSGVGIAVADQERVFQKYFQVGNPTHDRHKGRGLGLANARQVAKRLGHRIELDSRLGHGTRLRLLVPATTQRPPTALAPVVNLSLAGLRVAVIEDDRIVREAMCALLRRWGCEVRAADSADGILSEASPAAQAIIADYQLGDGRNGVDAIETLRKAWGVAVPALMVSGETVRPGDERARGIPAKDWLLKPVQPAPLQSWLAVHASAREPGEKP